MTPPHIGLGQLKSLYVRMTAALLIQSLPQGDPRRKEEITKIFRAVAGAGDALALNGTERLDDSVKTLASALRGVLKPETGSEADRLLTEISGFSCGNCTATPSVCRGERDHDNHVITEGGLCIKPLAQLLDRLVELTWAIYAAATPELPRPRVVLATDHAHCDNTKGVLGTHGMAGWHRLESDGATSWSIVGLTIREGAFEWASICSAYYQLMHEVFCHGFQGLGPGTGERSHADPHCSWSEGWMDRLAYHVALETLESRRDPALPGWVWSAAGDVRRAADSIHLNRYIETDKLQDYQVDALKMACDGFDTLRQALTTGYGPLAEHRATLFSVKLNAMRMPDTVYEDIGALLGPLLRYGDRQVVADIAGLCSDFVYTPGFDGVELRERLLAMTPAKAA